MKLGSGKSFDIQIESGQGHPDYSPHSFYVNSLSRFLFLVFLISIIYILIPSTILIRLKSTSWTVYNNFNFHEKIRNKQGYFITYYYFFNIISIKKFVFLYYVDNGNLAFCRLFFLFICSEVWKFTGYFFIIYKSMIKF